MEDQEPLSESRPATQPQTRCPTEWCNGSQRANQLEGGSDYRQDGKVPAPSLNKEQEVEGSTTQSVHACTVYMLLFFCLFFYIPVTAYDFLVFLTARDAEKTASPNQEQEKHPKASPGRVTQTRREKGDYNFRLKTNNPLMVYLTLSITLHWVIDAFQDDLSFLSLHNLFCIHCPLWFNRTAANTNPSLYKGGRRKK